MFHDGWVNMKMRVFQCQSFIGMQFALKIAQFTCESQVKTHLLNVRESYVGFL